jgi:hypothetical protein
MNLVLVTGRGGASDCLHGPYRLLRGLYWPSSTGAVHHTPYEGCHSTPRGGVLGYMGLHALYIRVTRQGGAVEVLHE